MGLWQRDRTQRQALQDGLIKPRGPWHAPAAVELATAEWIDWYNHTRLHGGIGRVPPAEHEVKHCQRQPNRRSSPQRRVSGGPGALHVPRAPPLRRPDDGR
ncbi:integrase core domain-containing protein [Embleya sp. NBC_00888]|uniref:integrase core domain-containing protein n=1 Tax=Embleya sp. NBC_00888 TaxID=2975960 RepID=UPI00386BBADB